MGLILEFNVALQLEGTSEGIGVPENSCRKIMENSFSKFTD